MSFLKLIIFVDLERKNEFHGNITSYVVLFYLYSIVQMECEDFCVDHCSAGYCERTGWYDQCYNGCMNSCPEWRPDFYTCYDWGAGNCIHLDLDQFFDCKDCYIEGCCAVDCQYTNK